jgi:starch phosphorylase
VGRVPLFLLDTNVDANQPQDRSLTDRLYGGDLEWRLKQEIVIGVGGLRALEAMGLRPAVCHMNEGHSSFLALERARLLMREHQLAFDEARELGAAGCVFTTHTPVPAGNDRFPAEMIERYFGAWPQELGLSREAFLGLGREDATDQQEHFCMTVLALKLAAKSNGVSKLHGHVSRNMWKRVWSGAPVHEIPIGAITNGVHQRSFLSADMRRLFDSYLGPKWHTEPEEPATWERIDRIPAEELWRTHERSRERTITFARARLAQQIERRGRTQRETTPHEVLDPEALTIGFARRFAAYKRATLVLRDPARLARILNASGRPVQLVFAGKAHQKDEAGKEIIRKVVHLANQPEFRSKIVFLEDYDINVARALVQGVDVWLNTPVRPLEASGTSGMKAVVNGAIHVSVLDGWWAECYDPQVGWAIGNAEEYADREIGERIESEALYHLLESELVPLFYERGKDGLPRRWIELMKRSMKALGPVFNTHRMVREYFETTYAPVTARQAELTQDGHARAKAIAQFKRRVAAQWGRVEVRSVDARREEVVVGEPLVVRAQVALGELSPADVNVQLFHGPVDVRGELVEGRALPMIATDGEQDGAYTFVGEALTRRSGRYGFAVRVLPRQKDLMNPFDAQPPKWG